MYVLVSLGIYPGVELLGHEVTLCLTFQELPDCFPTWLHHITFPPAVFEGSNFFTSLLTLVIIWFFDYSRSCTYEVVSSRGFDLHFPNE